MINLNCEIPGSTDHMVPMKVGRLILGSNRSRGALRFTFVTTMLKGQISVGKSWEETEVVPDSFDKDCDPWVEYIDPFGRVKVIRESQAIKRKEMDMKWQSTKAVDNQNGSFIIKPPTILSDQQTEINDISPYESPSNSAYHLYLHDRRRHSLQTRLHTTQQLVAARPQVLYYPPPSAFSSPSSSSLRLNSSGSNLFRQDLMEFQQYVINTIITGDSRKLPRR